MIVGRAGAAVAASLAFLFTTLSGSAATAAHPTGAPCGWGSGDSGVVRGHLRGDVNGDGLGDAVSVIARYGSRQGCRFALRVQIARGATLVLRLPDSLGDADAATVRAQPWPRLVVLAKIDSKPGAQPIVSLDAGASTVFFGIFALRGQHLLKLESPRFAVGASGVASAVDCWHGSGSDEVVSSFAQSTPRGWTVQRRLYRLIGNRFRRVPQSLPVLHLKSTATLPEFRGGMPFPSCTRAIATRR